MDLKKIMKSLGIIACIILLCTLIVKYTTPSETLLDYANENPELAYASPSTSSPTPTDSVLSDESISSEPQPTVEMTDVSPSIEPENTPSPTVSVAAVDSFSYSELTNEVKVRITGISYPITRSEADSLAVPAVNILSDSDNLQISYEDLRYLTVLYYDFDGNIQEGELICNAYIAEDLKEIFYELYRNEYRIESIRLIDDYNGDDTASMEANNTSCFNYRVVDGTTSLSKHALGCAIDINPFYNPYVVFDKTGNGQDYISPKGSEIYADRSKDFAYKIDENDLCYKLFKEHGFTWGGDWNSCKDYQHFQKVPN